MGQSILTNEASTTTSKEHELHRHDATLESLMVRQSVDGCHANTLAGAKPE